MCGRLICRVCTLPKSSSKWVMYCFAAGQVLPHVERKYDTPFWLQASDSEHLDASYFCAHNSPMARFMVTVSSLKHSEQWLHRVELTVLFDDPRRVDLKSVPKFNGSNNISEPRVTAHPTSFRNICTFNLPKNFCSVRSYCAVVR